MKHKHADVLIAIAEGKDVEYKLHNFSDWILASVNDSVTNPIRHDKLEWRVKRDPIIYSVFYKNTAAGYIPFTPDLEAWDLKVTFIDGKPSKAELPA